MSLSVTLWLVAFCSGAANFMMRGPVIALLHRVGKYVQLGSPRGIYYSDALPAKVLLLSDLSRSDRRLVRAYFATWALFLVSLPVAVIYLLSTT